MVLVGSLAAAAYQMVESIRAWTMRPTEEAFRGTDSALHDGHVELVPTGAASQRLQSVAIQQLVLVVLRVRTMRTFHNQWK